MNLPRPLALLAPLVLAAAASLALAGAAFANGNAAKVVNCYFEKEPGLRGTGKVHATIRARNLQKGTRFVAKCETARRLVHRAILKGPTRKRFVNSGFNCRPKLLSPGGLDMRWTCVYRGADNPTFSKVAFSLHFHT